MPRLKTGISLEPRSAARFNKTMKKLEVFANKEVSRVLSEEADVTVKNMRKDAPEDTGRLKTNIKSKKKNKEVGFTSEALNKSGEDYAWRQEFGVGAPRKEYFWPNIRKYKRKLTKRLRSLLRKPN